MGRAAYWAVPSLLSLALYWPGLLAWFQKDDFAWLGLRDLVHSWRDLAWALFAPLAQGTMRTLSERVFFLSFTSLFGLHALPFRIWVFAAGFGTLAVLCAVCARLTRSRAAGFWAAVLWIVNSNNAYVFSWTASYYVLMCTLFFLVALWGLIRYAETGNRDFLILQWATYLLGFLVLELNVVYPALALVYALCCARTLVRKVIPMFVPALGYTWLHLANAPLHSSGPYKMYWDSSVLSTFWAYWKSALGPNRLIYAGIHPSLLRSGLALGLMAGLLGFLVVMLLKRQWLTFFFASWFLIVLAPLLPLRDHISDYYLCIPTVGLAMWGSWAFICGWRAKGAARVAAVALLVVYTGINVVVARIACDSFYARSLRIHRFVDEVVALTAGHPENIILLKGVNEELFVDAVVHRPFRLYGRRDVYLVGAGTPAEFAIADETVRVALAERRAVLLDVSGENVRDITPKGF